MLTRENYSKEHIEALQKDSGNDPALLERVLFAFGLLEAISRVELPFIFKGGTCLMLLLKKTMRLSTDIDIVVEPGTDIDNYIDKAGKLFPFVRVEEQKRIGKNSIEKRHFKFAYLSPTSGREVTIWLDVLFEENHYPSVVKRSIENELLLVEKPDILVQIPNINCILGDKLTAFAPNTTGIPFGVSKELEIMKQMFDCMTLFREMSDFKEVKSTYDRIVKAELAYRGLDISKEDVLKDTINACVCIIGRGSIRADDYRHYQKGLNGIRGHIYKTKYNGEYAALYACEVMYLAASVLTNQENCPLITEPEKYIDSKIALKEYQKLSYIKKAKLEAYGYVVEAVKMLE
ncbi:MAG: nucleotidyl transferase AbiEii/AbiGii toxin family protein [Lachnospiraceae bacterium]|nr:nucleotidyl transferase AbiEii/AbiGii toxin family protein [Lachnospiraceae bacterium]